MPNITPPFRLLIIEDNAERLARLVDWLPSEVLHVAPTSAGKALGILQRDRGHVYGGILLDHDLGEQAATVEDLGLSGRNVVDAILRQVSNVIPILVHSTNPGGAAAMSTPLRHAWFDVTRVPMSVLNAQTLRAWIRDAQELWEETQG